MAKLGIIVILLLALLVGSCHATVVEKCHNVRSYEKSYKECMTELLNEYWHRCNDGCNVIIYRYKSQDLTGPGYRDPQDWDLSSRSKLPHEVIFTEDINIKSPTESNYYHVLAFHDGARFETSGWGGWDSWAFMGNYYYHPPSSIKFFEN